FLPCVADMNPEVDVFERLVQTSLDLQMLIWAAFVHEEAVPEIFRQSILDTPDRVRKVELAAHDQYDGDRDRVPLRKFFEQLFPRRQPFSGLLACGQW